MIEEKTEFNISFKRVKKRNESKDLGLLEKVKHAWNTLKNFF